MPATSHTHTKTARPNSGAASPQQPGSAAGPQAARPPAPRVPAAAPGSRGLFPGPARTRRASFRSARPALGLNRSFSRPCARFAVSCSFRVSPFLPFCLLLPSCFPPPVYPLRSISARFFFSCSFICYFPFGAARQPPLPSAIDPLLRYFVPFPFPSFWLFTPFGLLPAHFVADLPAVAGASGRSFGSCALRGLRGARARAGAPSGDAARGVGPARRRAPGQAGYLSPAVRSALRDRRLWLGSEEPGQLLLIKAQLWFLSGEPLSKGTDTKLRGLAHFLR